MMATTASLADYPGKDSTQAAHVLALVIAWSAEEPERVGETALLTSPSAFLGRSDEDKAAQRLRFVQQRPGLASRPRSIEGRAISRRQVDVEVRGEALHVKRVGRCPMAINGNVTDEGSLFPGDTLLLERQLLLYCVQRPKMIAALRHFSEEHWGAFGEADKLSFIGESAAAWRLRDRIAFAAKADTHVLLVGESGTGKELAAGALHAMSHRRRKPFVARNAATLPVGLIDAELFGNVKHYPNAGMPERPGLVGQAHEGMLFLDEIGELPSEMQAHLLRVLDAHGEYQRLGDATMRRSDLILVGATNRAARSLKHDLLARLTVRIELPPLAERREDVPLLLRQLLLRATRRAPDLAARFVENRSRDRLDMRIDAKVVEHLLRRRFALNVRELDAVLWRLMESSPGDVLTTSERALEEDFDAGTNDSPQALESRSGRESEPTAAEVVTCLERTGGSITKAAKALGLPSRYALYRLLKKHGLPTPPR